MTEIIVAIISSVAVLGAAIITLGGRYLGTMREAVEKLDAKTERIRAQVENSHSTNLREELDERHAETRRWFDRASDAIDETRRDISGMRSEIRGLRTRDDGIDDRVQRVESTVNHIIKKEKP